MRKSRKLKETFAKKTHTEINAEKENYQFFKNFKIIRSSELVYIANKKGLVELKDPRVLEAMLYAIKYRGCSISEQEVEEMKRI